MNRLPFVLLPLATISNLRKNSLASCHLTWPNIHGLDWHSRCHVSWSKEGRTMATKILVPLKKHDRLDEIVPYIQELAEPGASVVFLIHHPVSGFKWLQAYAAISQCGIETAMVIRRMAVTTTVDIYAGSLSKTLRHYMSNGDVQFVVMQPGIGQRIGSYRRGMVSIRSIFRHPFSSSMFIRPSA
jgi:hypothetical protein